MKEFCNCDIIEEKTYTFTHVYKMYFSLQVISLESWVNIMYYVQDAHSFWDWSYFVALIVVSYNLSLYDLECRRASITYPDTFISNMTVCYYN